MAPSDPSQQKFKAMVVATILDSHPDLALDMLSEHYKVDRPKLGVGVVKGRSKGVQAVYTAGRKEILAANSDYLYDPFTIIHEFYHHLHYHGMKHRGTEKHADRFALDFIRAYNAEVSRIVAEKGGLSRP